MKKLITFDHPGTPELRQLPVFSSVPLLREEREPVLFPIKAFPAILFFGFLSQPGFQDS
jgi:hypothetical protein